MNASLAATGRYVETCIYVTGGKVSDGDSCFGHCMNCVADVCIHVSLAASARSVETCRYVTGSGADSCFGHDMNFAAE